MRVGHIFSCETNHLNKSKISLIDTERLDSTYYLRNVNNICSKKDAVRQNEHWMRSVKRAEYGGFLQLPLALRLCKTRGRLYILIKYILTDFSLLSWCKILKGPKNIFIHGFALNVSTLVILLLIGKRVVYLSWGGKPCFCHLTRFLDILAYKLYHHIFVLMKPEIRYYTELLQDKKISLLPYPITQESFVSRFMYASYPPKKILLIGNSAWFIAEYRNILDKISVGSWDKIICMLNYGNEKNIGEVKLFCKEYKLKFGDSLFPWTNTVPTTEYLKTIAEAPFYICTAKTQTGLGIIRWSLIQGKAIFISGDNFEWIRNDMGMDVHNADEFNDYNYATLCSHIPTSEEYSRRVSRLSDFCSQHQSLLGWRMAVLRAFE